MLSIFITLATVSASVAIFIRLERSWKNFLTVNMRKQYNSLCIAIFLGECTWQEANAGIADFKSRWIAHPECEMYVGLLRNAISKINL